MALFLIFFYCSRLEEDHGKGTALRLQLNWVHYKNFTLYPKVVSSYVSYGPMVTSSLESYASKIEGQKCFNENDSNQAQ